MAEEADCVSTLMLQILQLPQFTALFLRYQVSYLQVGGDSHWYETQWSEFIISYYEEKGKGMKHK